MKSGCWDWPEVGNSGESRGEYRCWCVGGEGGRGGFWGVVMRSEGWLSVRCRSSVCVLAAQWQSDMQTAGSDSNPPSDHSFPGESSPTSQHRPRSASDGLPHSTPINTAWDNNQFFFFNYVVYYYIFFAVIPHVQFSVSCEGCLDIAQPFAASSVFFFFFFFFFLSRLQSVGPWLSKWGTQE